MGSRPRCISYLTELPEKGYPETMTVGAARIDFPRHVNRHVVVPVPGQEEYTDINHYPR